MEKDWQKGKKRLKFKKGLTASQIVRLIVSDRKSQIERSNLYVCFVRNKVIPSALMCSSVFNLNSVSQG